MIKLSVLSEITQEQFTEAAELWNLTGVGNPARGDTLEAVQKTLAHGGRMLLLYDDGLPVGTVWLSHDQRRLYIHHMAVRPERQHQGLGRRLLKQALAYASELQLQAKLEVHTDNPAALELYKSEGFQTLEGYLAMIKREI